MPVLVACGTSMSGHTVLQIPGTHDVPHALSANMCAPWTHRQAFRLRRRLAVATSHLKQAEGISALGGTNSSTNSAM